MQTQLLGATALVLVATVNLSSARAEGPKLSGRTSWSGISLRVDHDTSPVPASPALPGPEPTAETWRGILDLPADLSEAVIIPHYEWQYHYVGRHAHWEGHQVLVMAPTQSARG